MTFCGIIDGLKRFLRRIDGSAAEMEALRQNMDQERLELNERIWSLRLERDQTSEENRRLQWHIKTLAHANDELKRQPQEYSGIPIDDSKKHQEDVELSAVRNELITHGSLDELELNVRTYNYLKRHGINTVAELLGYTALELLNEVRNFGEVSLNNLVVQLGRAGLKLKDEATERDRARAFRILKPSRMKLVKVEDMELSEGAYKAVLNAGIKTAFDIFRYPSCRLMLELSSPEYAGEVAAKMATFGFDLT